MINKKGAIESRYIIMIIILIASFAALLIFFFMLDIDDIITQETCKSSIALKSIPLISVAMSVNCPIQDVCIYKKGVCVGASDNAKKTQISEEGEEFKKAVMKKLAEIEVNAWSTVYEGKKDFPKKEDNCLLLYRIYFDNLVEGIGDIKYSEYKLFLKENKINSELSYFDYLDEENKGKNEIENKIEKENKKENNGQLIYELDKPLAVVVAGGDVKRVFLMEYSPDSLKKLDCEVVNFV